MKITTSLQNEGFLPFEAKYLSKYINEISYHDNYYNFDIIDRIFLHQITHDPNCMVFASKLKLCPKMRTTLPCCTFSRFFLRYLLFLRLDTKICRKIMDIDDTLMFDISHKWLKQCPNISFIVISDLFTRQ